MHSRESVMKTLLLSALCSFTLFAGVGCSNMRVVDTQVATGVDQPKAIYIRPFQLVEYRDRCNPNGAVGRSLVPKTFAGILQEELSKIAPSMVLMDDEVPTTGWLVEGSIEVMDAGSPRLRALPLLGSLGRVGSSNMVVHVRITEMRAYPQVARTGDLQISTGKEQLFARTIYEFDVAGGHYVGGALGTVATPGLGDARPFDMRNTAERIMLALSPDAFRYGARTSPVARN